MMRNSTIYLSIYLYLPIYLSIYLSIQAETSEIKDLISDRDEEDEENDEELNELKLSVRNQNQQLPRFVFILSQTEESVLWVQKIKI